MKLPAILSIIISVFVIALLIFQFRIFPNNSENEFRLSDTAAVELIRIEGMDTVEIKRVEDHWIVNNVISSNPTAVSNFFYAFSNLETLGIQTDISGFEGSGKKIIIGSGKKTIRLRFYTRGEAEFLHHEGAKKIYRIGILGNPDAKLENVFSEKALYWQSRILINISPDEIQKIDVFPGDPWKSDFILIREENEILLTKRDGTKAELNNFKREKALMYFSYFSELFYDDILSDTLFETFSNEKEFFRIRITDFSGKVEEISVFPLYNSNKEKDIFSAAVVKSSSEMIFKVNYSMLDLLFEDYESFLLN